MKINSCPRCGQIFATWQPVHLPCLIYRLRYFLITLLVSVTLAGGSALYFVLSNQIVVWSGVPFFGMPTEPSTVPDSTVTATPIQPTNTLTSLQLTLTATIRAFTPTPIPTLSPTPEVVGVVNTATLNLRSGPGVEYPSVAKLMKGVRFIVISKSSNWLQIQTDDGFSGWLNERYTIVTGPIESISDEFTTVTSTKSPEPQPADTAIPTSVPTPSP